MDEFERINKFFAPLSKSVNGDVFGDALGLLDDAALILEHPDTEIVITKDMLVEGVHFLKSDPLDLVSRKLLRVNLSDLAAKGAVPKAYLLGTAWPKGWRDEQIEKFADGLRQDQDEFGIYLLGGDTVSTDGPLVVSLTMLGLVGQGQMIKRSTANAGDDVYVTGTIGDACAGLDILKNATKKSLTEEEMRLVSRYQHPQPRVEIGKALWGLASSAVDVSDGLVADCGHIAEASNVKLTLNFDKIPCSQEAVNLVGDKKRLITFGDDYEIVFTASTDSEQNIYALSKKLGLAITKIGRIATGAGVEVNDAKGNVMAFDKSGYTHL